MRCYVQKFHQSRIFGDLTIFKMAPVRHFESVKFVYAMWSPCYILLPCAKFHWNRIIGHNDFQYGDCPPYVLNFFKNSYLVARLSSSSKRTVVYQVSSKSSDFFVEIWRFYNFQDGGSPPPWILGVRPLMGSLNSSWCRTSIIGRQ